jgi:hypothetical protein
MVMKTSCNGKIYGMLKAGKINLYFDNIISRLPEKYQRILKSMRSRHNSHHHWIAKA